MILYPWRVLFIVFLIWGITYLVMAALHAPMWAFILTAVAITWQFIRWVKA